MDFEFLEKISPFELREVLTIDSLLFVVLSYALLWLAKVVNDFFQSSFSLDEELLVKDNKALAVSFSGYFLGVGIIIYSVLLSPASQYFGAVIEKTLLTGLIDTIVWGTIGILLLNLSRVINDLFLLPHFKNRDEIIRDHNVGTGVVQFGGYFASALIIVAIIGQEGGRSFWIDLFYTLFYYFLAQICLLIYTKIYEKLLTYSLHEEIEKDNVAAGLALSLNLIAISLFLFFSLKQSENILLFLAWFVNGVVFINLSRILFNKIFLRKSDFTHEIQTDQNWGIALIEGVVAILVAYIVNASLL